GKNYKDICEWLDVMTATTIVSDGVVYIAGQKRFARDRFHVFDRAVSVGKELPDGSIADANYVWLSEWQLENINQNYLIPIDSRKRAEQKGEAEPVVIAQSQPEEPSLPEPGRLEMETPHEAVSPPRRGRAQEPTLTPDASAPSLPAASPAADHGGEPAVLDQL